VTPGPGSARIRPVQQQDLAAWKPLWVGYIALSGRRGATALPARITEVTWNRFFDPAEPVFALVAEAAGKLVGFTHYLFHRTTTQTELICYLEDLFTLPAERGKGIGRALIEGVYAEARRQGVSQVYWQTHVTNKPGRLLYDQVAEHLGFIVYSHDV
jgi:GNAT superfamily N-acetyltransferase